VTVNVPALPAGLTAGQRTRLHRLYVGKELSPFPSVPPSLDTKIFHTEYGQLSDIYLRQCPLSADRALAIQFWNQQGPFSRLGRRPNWTSVRMLGDRLSKMRRAIRTLRGDHRLVTTGPAPAPAPAAAAAPAPPPAATAQPLAPVAPVVVPAAIGPGTTTTSSSISAPVPPPVPAPAPAPNPVLDSTLPIDPVLLAYDASMAAEQTQAPSVMPASAPDAATDSDLAADQTQAPDAMLASAPDGAIDPTVAADQTQAPDVMPAPAPSLPTVQSTDPAPSTTT
jgi:hypothetical protein